MAVNRSNTSPAITNTGGLQRARDIANQNLTPLEVARSKVGGNTPSVPYIEPKQVAPAELPQQTESPLRTDGENKYIPPVIDGKLNQEYIRNIPPRADTPITQSISDEIDEIIRGSEEVVKEIIVKQEPVLEQVDTVQDNVRPPVAITPTELILENQKNCEDTKVLPSIVINNNNEVIVDIGPLSATSSFSIPEVIVVEQPRLGCTDPDALNYDPSARIDNASCKYEPVDEGEPVTIDDPPPPPPLKIPDLTPFVDSHGRTIFTIPRELVELTERTDEDGLITLPSGKRIIANLALVKQVLRPAEQDSDIIHTPVSKELAERLATRDELGELASDTKLATDEDIVIFGKDRTDHDYAQALGLTKKEYLAQKAAGTLSQTYTSTTNITRNDRGIIILRGGETSKLKISLRNKSFSFNQYQKTVDTEFDQLVGKL